MTRGTFYCVTDKLIVETIEFNGDMYPEGHGHNAIRMLEEVKNMNDFRYGVEKFNKENHNYSVSQMLFPHKRSRFIKGRGNKNRITMTDKNYYKLYFSDWTFWKNISSETVSIKTRGGSFINLLPNEQVAISFGYFEEHYRKADESVMETE